MGTSSVVAAVGGCPRIMGFFKNFLPHVCAAKPFFRDFLPHVCAAKVFFAKDGTVRTEVVEAEDIATTEEDMNCGRGGIAISHSVLVGQAESLAQYTSKPKVRYD